MPDIFQSIGKDRDRRFDDTAKEVTTVPSSSPSQEIVPTQEAAVPLTKMQRFKNKVNRMNLFSAFCENPDDVHFETQEPDEKILVFLRKSNFMNLPWILSGLALILIPFILYLFRSQYAQITPPLPYILVLVPFYYILILSYMFVHFLTWYYNAAMITSKRVIDIDFHQLVMKEVNETKLDLVQDVSFRQDGVFENIFDFGYVLI